jgi:23S rRNA pseudouridine2605 synthase
LTSEQLEAARAERLRHNGLGTLTLDEARTWIEETGLCLYLPRKQFASSIAPSFVEATIGHRDDTPSQKQIAVGEDLLVRLELEGVAVRLNLLGQPGEQPDFVVASWVLPYVYALRGDRDWRRIPQLTGSRQVSPLAVQVYKQLEQGDATVSHLRHALGREVTESAVIRAITELWQQLRIIPVIEAPGKAAKWQLLRHRFQKAIAEGASTSQVTAISVLASIYLQAVIAASMEEVEIFLSPLTARSKVREVIRGLVATRQVHTISLGPAPHFYVAGTLPEFAPASSIYSSVSMAASSYFMRDDEDSHSGHSPARSLTPPNYMNFEQRRPVESRPAPAAPSASAPSQGRSHATNHASSHASSHTASHSSSNGTGHGTGRASNGKSQSSRPHFKNGSRAPRHTSSSTSRPARRSNDSRPAAKRSTSTARPASSSRWSSAKPKSNGHRSSTQNGNGSHRTASESTNGHRPAKAAWSKSNGRAAAKSAAGTRTNGHARKDARAEARPSRPARKPVHSARSGSKSGKRMGVAAGSARGNKKRG